MRRSRRDARRWARRRRPPWRVRVPRRGSRQRPAALGVPRDQARDVERRGAGSEGVDRLEHGERVFDGAARARVGRRARAPRPVPSPRARAVGARAARVTTSCSRRSAPMSGIIRSASSSLSAQSSRCAAESFICVLACVSARPRSPARECAGWIGGCHQRTSREMTSRIGARTGCGSPAVSPRHGDPPPVTLGQYCAENAPSDLSSCPETQRPSSDTRNSTTAATSAGRPSRPSGVIPASPVRVSSSIQPVSMGPGFSTFAEMPRGPSSRAAEMTNRSRAPLDAP